MNDSNKFYCLYCTLSYNHIQSLKRHLSKVHPKDALKLNKTHTNNCTLCEKTFKFKKNLICHQRELHGINKAKKCIKCPLCNYTTPVKKIFFQHTELVHEIRVDVKELAFNTVDDFYQWKEKIEKETLCKYKKNRGRSSMGCRKNSERLNYICHRSGFYTPSGSSKRRLKTQGSKKINGMCPSSIRVHKAENGTCQVQFVPTHVGHQNEVCHLNLTDSERKSIATDIANKIPFDDILHKVRDSVSNWSVERIHLLTKKDLYNIKHEFSLTSGAERYKDDGTSVEAWVKEVNSSEHPSVLFYKPQGTEHPVLKTEDFALVIMNSAQCKILKRHGSDCVCLDEAHGLNSYGFTLTTILVLDDLRQGFPCAFLISNRNDQKMLNIFFEFVKSQTDTITPNVFMSDMAESLFNSWLSVMGRPVQRLFCTWHVDKAWIENLNSKIQGGERKAEIYKLLRTLMQERDQDSFNILFHSAMNKLINDPETLEFGNYFTGYYSKHIESWAYCYRLNSGQNTNMHIETSMQKTLKYIYLHGKKVKRLDKAIHGLMSFVKDELFDKLIVLNKRKIISEITAIRKRHKSSLDLKAETIVKEGDNWLVPSSSPVKEMYIVRESDMQCQCKLLCPDCNICMHKYTCTCIDSCIKWNMCKHVHLVCRFRSLEKTGENEDVSSCSQEDYDFYIHTSEAEPQVYEILKEVSKEKNEALLSEEKEKTKAKYLSLLDSVQNKNELDILKNSFNQLEATINAVRSSYMNLPIRKLTNKKASKKRKITPKRQLVPTEKTKKIPQGAISTPSELEVQSITMSAV